MLNEHISDFTFYLKIFLNESVLQILNEKATGRVKE